MTTYPRELSSHPIVAEALASALAPIAALEIIHLLGTLSVSRFAAGAPVPGAADGHLRVVVLGAVTTPAATERISAGQVMAARREPYRALREVLIANIPFEAFAAWDGERLLRMLSPDANPAATKSQRLLIGISSCDERLALDFQQGLAQALETHGTVSTGRIDAPGPLPTRIALERSLPPADFQVALFPAPTSPRDVPAVDRWLFVVDGERPGAGHPMPRQRMSGYATAVRTSASIPPPLGEEPLRFRPLPGEAGLSPRTLILAHDRSLRVPRQTVRHLAFHRPDDHRHVRLGHAGDSARIARELAGVPAGFTLGAGGARGLAHLGALRAAEEEGIRADYISGTSIGAVIGALVGLGLDVPARREAAGRLASARPFNDFTLPTTALLRGRRFELLAEEFFGGLDLADLWVPLVTMSCDLGEFAEIVHRRGPLKEVLLAGCVLPGILPPRIFGGRLHVDGGTSNMLPVELLRAHSPGPVVAVDVSPWEPLAVPEGGYPVGADALLARLRGRPAPLGALQVFWRAVSYYVAARARTEGALADVLILPDVGAVGTSNLEGLREIEQAGYAAARVAFATPAGERLSARVSSRRAAFAS